MNRSLCFWVPRQQAVGWLLFSLSGWLLMTPVQAALPFTVQAHTGGGGCCSKVYEAVLPFTVEAVAKFDHPWALAFLPDGRMLITERPGQLLVVSRQGRKSPPVKGLPEVDYSGQGGLGDVALHPDYAKNRLIYLSYVEAGPGDTRGAVVARAKLDLDKRQRGSLRGLSVIWRQYPKVSGHGHYGYRLLFDRAGYLWITSGERQKFTPSQDMQSSLGKVLRLQDNGRAPADNPFVDFRSVQPLVDGTGIYSEIWSLGHRNPLGMDFDQHGRLWVVEMGPAGGDELNLIKRGSNYGYPVVSNGNHYDGRKMPNHATRPEFSAPAVWWTPVISPGDMAICKACNFPDWHGQALIAGLSAQALIRVDLGGERAKEVARYNFGQRIRAVEQSPDGDIWLLEDQRLGSDGELLRLSPL